MSLCQYRDILGKPKQGIHSYRVLNFAIADILMTVIAAYLISWFFKLPFVYTLLVLFILGIILHRLFCVPTTIDRLLFSGVSPSSV